MGKMLKNGSVKTFTNDHKGFSEVLLDGFVEDFGW
jgi:hypothetical protein